MLNPYLLLDVTQNFPRPSPLVGKGVGG